MKIKTLYFSRKYIPSAKTYTENLSNITFYYSEISPSFLSLFWSQKPFFTIQLFSVFLNQTIHTFDRNIPSKHKVLDFLLPELSFKKLFISFLKQKVSFFFQSLVYSSVWWERMKIAFRIASARIKIYQIRNVIFATKNLFFIKLCIAHQCHERSFFCISPSKTLYALEKRNPSKCKTSEL